MLFFYLFVRSGSAELGQPIARLKDSIRESVYHPMFSNGK